MLNQSVIIILIIGLFVLLVGFLIAVGVLVYSAFEIKKVSASVREFLKDTDDRIKPVLEETEQTLKSIRKVSDDIGYVTDNVKNLSASIKEIAINLEALSAMAKELRHGLSLRVLGLKAGIKTAAEVLIKQIKDRRV